VGAQPPRSRQSISCFPDPLDGRFGHCVVVEAGLVAGVERRRQLERSLAPKCLLSRGGEALESGGEAFAIRVPGSFSREFDCPAARSLEYIQHWAVLLVEQTR
jgi:hypothetical protein